MEGETLSLTMDAQVLRRRTENGSTTPMNITPEQASHHEEDSDRDKNEPLDTPTDAHVALEETIALHRRLSAEYVGTLFFALVGVGSGIWAEKISDDVGVQVTINGISIFCGLCSMIVIFAPISGGHFNPAISVVDLWYGDMDVVTYVFYFLVQTAGALSGTVLANVLNDHPTEVSTQDRFDYQPWLGEIVGTSSLILVIHGCIRTGKPEAVPPVASLWVASGYIVLAYANPAITIGRMFTNSLVGIEPKSGAVYIVCQYVGALLGYILSNYFYPNTS